MFFNNEFVHQALLYTGNDLLQYTFRVELRMKDDVNQDALRYAVDCTMQRYPYLAVKTEENETEIDIIHNESPVVICEGKTTPCLCTEAANRHFIAVPFEGNRIFLDVHHGLTDGTGMERVAKTLVYYYVTRRYAITIDCAGINTLQTPIAPDEYKDPFSNAKDLPEKPLSVYAAEPAFHLGSVNNITEKKRIYYFKVKESDVMKVAKSNDGTPNALFSAILYKAISKHHPDAAEPIVGGVAFSTRKALNIDASTACLIGIIHIKYNDRVKDASIDKLGTLGRGSIILQSDDQNVLASIPGKRQLTQYLKTIPDHYQRRMIFHGLIQKTTCLDTYSVSYIGKNDWDCFSDYVDAYYTIAEPRKGGIILEINTHNGWFDVCVTQDVETDRYVDSVIECLKEFNIEYSFEGKDEITLPTQKVLP
ncbi:MAG: hypothetical protein IKV41_00585 [Oscillospiraceae bacterium]|nr:hypothetical protein [Oscillospiraceae bacterium]